MNRREFVTAAGAAAVVGGVAVPRVAQAYSVSPKGTGDDTDQLQDALDNYLNVELAAGTYYITRSLVITSGIWFHGAGMNDSFIRWHAQATPTSNQPLFLVDDDVQNVLISDLAFSSGHSIDSTRVGECGIDVGTGEVGFQDCLFQDITGADVGSIDGLVRVNVT